MTKVAIITGSSRGIGKKISHYFAQEGYYLILMSLNKLNLEQAKVEINTLFPSCNVEVVPIDFNVPSEVETTITSIIKKHKNIEVMVNSTGILAAGNTKLPLVKLSELMNVNLLSTITACNIVAEQMKKQGFGEIYNIGSTAGLTPVPKIAAYAASKAAIISYSESLYHELLPFGVKVCCLCPSVVNTDMTNDGRIDNKLKIETQDLTKALDFIRSLSSAATVSTLSIRCRIIDLE
ncbi:SDR family NAD(P)-dependent oxidoreductase [Vibrio cyclitrophicus]|uniref:SDR family NAD(P)-dependent oxidoreductase n=1 Tax=Vibrio cyclitrophicus TaxID=47951 RepID=UPI0002D7F547|nr:SDR family NAD(P)-dependent oxidoreductase [Vibrio cyclitrophicus]OCH39005.1 short-chain dehydrogenase [Vibrio cyclitrophicus]OED87091.1 short-chain dehydrogenase [Vibrio cyclitrophicus ZF30]OEF41154.1 short-chain dehydrogenase [Vibrio cyclitrophicus 1F289]PMP54508.1 short-chain dehydrogenase [Vibrio cyclitrophicus]